MPSFECKFNIGDKVVAKCDAQDWATGGIDNPPVAEQVTFISFGEDTIHVSTNRRSNFKEENIIPESELKEFAIKHLSNRLQNISAFEENGEGKP